MRKPIKREEPYEVGTFGSYIRAKRISQGISLRNLAEALKISPAYLSEIERDKRCAPSITTGLMDALIEELRIDAGDLDIFYDLAGASRDFMYEELCAYLKDHPMARRVIRIAAMAGTGDAFWSHVVESIERGSEE